MPSQQEIELIIKARNEAKQAFDELNQQANALTGSVKTTASETDKLSLAEKVLGFEVSSTAAAFLGLAGVAAGGTVVFSALLQKYVATGSALTDLSEKSRVGTTGLQELEFAGKKSQVSIEQISNSITNMSDRIAGGDRSAVNGLKALGISLDTIRQSSPEDAFRLIAERVREIPDPMQQAKVAMDLFGVSGKQVLPLLRSDLEALSEEAHQVGAVMSEEAVRAADELGDAWTKLTSTGSTLLGQVFVPLAPALTQVTEGLTGVTSGASALIGLGLDVYLESTANSWKLLVATMDRVKGSQLEQADVQQKQNKLTGEAVPLLQSYLTGALQPISLSTREQATLERHLAQGRTEANRATREAEAELRKYEATVKIFNEDKRKMVALMQDSAGVFRTYQRELPPTTTAKEALKKATDEYVAKLMDELNVTGKLTLLTVDHKAALFSLEDSYKALGITSQGTLQKTAEDAVRAYTAIKNSGTATPAEIRAAFEAMTDAVNAANGRIPSYWKSEVIPGITSTLDQLQTAVSGSFAQMLLGSKGFKEGWQDIWESIKASAFRIFNEIVEGFISGALKRILGALSGSGGGVSGGLGGILQGALGGGGGGGGGLLGAIPGLGGGSTGAIAGLPGGMAGLPGIGGAGGGAGGAGFMAGIGGGLLGGAGAGIGGFGLGYGASNQFGRPVGTAIGIGGGAAQGALIGSVVPGLGTAVGAGVGALAGLIGGLVGGGQGSREDKAANEQIKELQAELLKTYGSMEKIREVGKTIGVDLEAAWGHKGKRGLEAFMATANQFGVQQTALQSALERYGLTWENLGPQVKQSKIDEFTSKLLVDTKSLTTAGIDYETVISAQSDAFNELYLSILRTGTEAPPALQPIFEKMIEMGLLVDENGNKVTDLSQVHFKDLGATGSEAGKKITDSLFEMLAAAGTAGISTDTLRQKLKEMGHSEETINSIMDSIASLGDTIGDAAGEAEALAEAIASIPDEVSTTYTFNQEGEPPVLAASGIYAKRPTLAVFGEGGEPELGGPVDFMSKALAGAMRSMDARGVSADGQGGHVNLNITINALDPIGLREVVERQVVPSIVGAIKRNFGDARINLRHALGVP